MIAQSTSVHIKGIDTVRAIAALSVVFAHLLGPSMPGITKYAFTGHPAVIAFFVVSGFCIHFPFRNRELSALTFLKKRYTRILIPTVLAIGLAQLVGIRAYNPVDGYILWSVVCELIYYTLYPIFLPISRKVGWPVMIAAATAASYAIVLSLGSDGNGNAHIYGPSLNWLVALPSWLLGCYIAQIYRENLPVGNVWVWRVVTASLASGLYWATSNTPVGFYLTMTPFSVVAACWMIAEANAALRRVSILEQIGKACFSIYLIHVVSAAIIERFGVTSPIPVCAGSLALVYFFYRMVEKPAHELSRSIGRPPAFP